MTNFEIALASFVAGANAKLDAGVNKTVPAEHFIKKITIEEGSKYIRLVCSEGPQNGAACAWGFICKTTGNVLKAASWKTPAKNFARGNIFDAHNGLGRFCWTGVR